MVELSLRILQVNTADIAGGAEKIAWGLFRSYRSRGLSSQLAVGYKRSHDPDVLLIPNHSSRPPWEAFWRTAWDKLFTPKAQTVRGFWRLKKLFYGLGNPRWWRNIQHGHEDFDFPGTRQLLNLSSPLPHILHCHNLHGGYFDLRLLPWLCRQLPVTLTLHDTWLLSGHCAYSLDCERWRTGCGNCPYLNSYPAIPRDATADNWQRKRDIFAQCQVSVATPSRWLLDKVEQSMLAPSLLKSRVIHNGVDLSVFQPTDRLTVRTKLGLTPDSPMLLFVANNVKGNLYKDYQTIRASIGKLAERWSGQHVIFIALGGDAPPERLGPIEIQFVPYQKDAALVAQYYQAADVYLHAARADTFPTTILEALACGTPVVATAVGGIPEQVKPLPANGVGQGFSPEEATGILTPPRDAAAMANAVEQLLNNAPLRRQLGENAAKDARIRFDLERQVDSYLAWYQEIIEKYTESVNALPQLV